MAYNQTLEKRLDAALEVFPEEVRNHFGKKKMFGGLAYLFRNKMTVGINGDQLMVRVLDYKMAQLLEKSYVKPMDFTGKPMKEFIYVRPEGMTTEVALQSWLELGLEHARQQLKS